MLEAIRQWCKFDSAQPGFRRRTGAEMAIRRHIYNAPRMEYTVLSDLKAAHDSVPKKKLVEVLAKQAKQKQGGNG